MKEATNFSCVILIPYLIKGKWDAPPNGLVFLVVVMLQLYFDVGVRVLENHQERGRVYVPPQ